MVLKPFFSLKSLSPAAEVGGLGVFERQKSRKVEAINLHLTSD
ncbi:MAG: hypothetical protein ACI9XO_002408 [Paraglaciecola sp.]|jgi:hypothetical protein